MATYDLVFEGGGAKGMALVGAYEEFVGRGHAPGRLLGTSAGAIAVALVAAGYTPTEMLAALDERQDGKPVFASFLGQPPGFTEEEVRASSVRAALRGIDLKLVPRFVEERLDSEIAHLLARDRRFLHLFAFVERGGWYAADRFMAWLEAKLDGGLRNGEPRRFSRMSLAQFHDATRVDVSLVAADTTDGRLLVLNHKTAPGCPLVWAVRMSMSIPLVWDEVVWQPGWGTYLGRDLSAHVVVDGGLLSNFPLELFVSDEPYVVELMGPKHGIPVLGLLIDESLPVPSVDAGRGGLAGLDVDPAGFRTVQRIRRLADTATTARDSMVTEAYGHLVVRLPARGYGTTEFDMSDERRAALVEGGRAAMGTYLDAPPGTPGGTRDPGDAAGSPPTAAANRVAMRLLRPRA